MPETRNIDIAEVLRDAQLGDLRILAEERMGYDALHSRQSASASAECSVPDRSCFIKTGGLLVWFVLLESGAWASGAKAANEAPGGLRIEVAETHSSNELLTTVSFSWQAVSLFEGDYVVERALIGGASDLRAFSPVGRVPAASAAGGRLLFTEAIGCEIMTDRMPAYRVRTEQNAVLGPPSEERVVFFPPTDPGPSNPCQRLRGSVSPPAAGTGTSSGAADGWSLVALLGGLWLAGIGLVIIDRLRRPFPRTPRGTMRCARDAQHRYRGGSA